jgi:CheY-like chemotaxis protein
MDTPKKKILIVDDQRDIRRLVKLALAPDYVLLEAENGADALEVVRREVPDLVVLDIMMPGSIDGLGVLDAIRLDPELKDIKVVLISARGQARDYAVGVQHGADAYFIKPFSPIDLVDRISRLLK